MEFINNVLLYNVLQIITLCLIYYALVFLFKRYKYNISKGKIAQLVVLLWLLYYVVSIVLGIFFNIHI
jgi:K+-transporting ATPase A subunit